MAHICGPYRYNADALARSDCAIVVGGAAMVSERLVVALVLIAALGSGVVAGVFFAFSAFIMKALARLPPNQGIAAMQSINVVVLNAWFLGLFMGTAAISLIAVVYSLFQWDSTQAVYLLVGGTLYLIGTFLVTVLFNVPRNQALAASASDNPQTTQLWSEYVVTWTAWNHVRTLAALAAAAAFSLALHI
jgi:uncharacterized membrane protein